MSSGVSSLSFFAEFQSHQVLIMSYRESVVIDVRYKEQCVQESEGAVEAGGNT